MEDGRRKEGRTQVAMRGRAVSERARERVRPPRPPEGPGRSRACSHGISGFGGEAVSS